MKLTDEEIEERRASSRRAVAAAQKVLKKGDRLVVTKCPGKKRTITFDGWDGNWMVSKSGIRDFSPACVEKVNGRPVDFGEEIHSNEPT